MMDARRLKFAAALVVFFLWVAALGTMAVFSGHKPEVRHEVADPH